ncbi:hypothetical protein CFC21_098383 [Triticum aestivum]|uniref:TF-B3 domain-containing protein n=2 Tax=Triticum aestivum TaxID=4565 RepID=A0A3B6RHQ4_WHEAT|nr:hypothetical protein CFC21_098383 [Triticum aestivum]
MTLDFTKHFTAAPQEFKLKTNIGCTCKVTVRVINGRVTLDQGWSPYATVHQIKIWYLVTFKLLTLGSLKLTVFNKDDVKVVTKCKKHDVAFAMGV